VLEVNGRVLQLSENGFLVNAGEWDETVASVLAARANVQLTPAHWEIVRFIREYYLRFNHLPNARLFVKAVYKGLGEEKGNSAYLHRLFPAGPLRCACLIAGLPRPPGCL
jgi:tRNA 2-thiouridine synthesizing protein E